jgi:hypothetical protein
LKEGRRSWEGNRRKAAVILGEESGYPLIIDEKRRGRGRWQ